MDVREFVVFLTFQAYFMEYQIINLCFFWKWKNEVKSYNIYG